MTRCRRFICRTCGSEDYSFERPSLVERISGQRCRECRPGALKASDIPSIHEWQQIPYGAGRVYDGEVSYSNTSGRWQDLAAESAAIDFDTYGWGPRPTHRRSYRWKCVCGYLLDTHSSITPSERCPAHLLIVDRKDLIEIPPNVFAGMDALRRLRIRSETLRKLSPNAFEGLQYLQSLDLSANKLRTLSPAAFDGLDSLHTLNLQYNNLKKLAPVVFGSLNNLQTVILEGNNLRSLPPDLFNGLTNLERLYLGTNPGAPFRIAHPNANLRGDGWVR